MSAREGVRRRAVLAALPMLAAGPGRAQDYPSRSIRFIVAWPPGGSVDVTSRILAPRLQQELGQTLVIENRGGASGSIGSGVAAAAAPDGYTLLADAGGQAVNPSLLRGLGFDYATAFAPVTQLTNLPALLLVRAASPHRTMAQLLAALRARPGALSYGSTGIGTGSHLASALLIRRAGVTAVHVPYRGGAQQIPGLLGGETDFVFSTTPLPAPLVRDGQLRALAVSTARRLAAFPDVPTVAEQGFPDFAVFDWIGLYVPAGTPGPIIERLAAAAHVALRDPAAAERLAILGMEAVGAGPAALAAFLAEQRTKMGELIRAEGISLE